jgi:hypothetical protein
VYLHRPLPAKRRQLFRRRARDEVFLSRELGFTHKTLC